MSMRVRPIAGGMMFVHSGYNGTAARTNMLLAYTLAELTAASRRLLLAARCSRLLLLPVTAACYCCVTCCCYLLPVARCQLLR